MACCGQRGGAPRIHTKTVYVAVDAEGAVYADDDGVLVFWSVHEARAFARPLDAKVEPRKWRLDTGELAGGVARLTSCVGCAQQMTNPATGAAVQPIQS